MKLTGKVWKYGAQRGYRRHYPGPIPEHIGRSGAGQARDGGPGRDFRRRPFVRATSWSRRRTSAAARRASMPRLLSSRPGVSCVIAETFARIFYRNAINIGLPILECAEAAADVQAGQELEVDLTSGRIRNLSTGKEYQAKPYPEFMLGIVEAGGLMAKITRDMKKTTTAGRIGRAAHDFDELEEAMAYKIAVIPGDGTGPEVIRGRARRFWRGGRQARHQVRDRRRSISAASATSAPASCCRTRRSKS